MENWGRQNSANYHQHHHRHHHQGGSRQRSQSGRPPRDDKSSIPSWEKKFCASVGSVPWWKLVEAKRLMYLFDDVVKWNDSAGEEAFWNAKNRFWAEINGLPCDIKFPDPDIYIDEIDWDAEINPELLLDLEREPAIPNNETAEEGVIVNLGVPLDLAQSFPCSGWGDDEVEVRGGADSHSPPLIEDCVKHIDNTEDSNHHQSREGDKEVGFNNWEDQNDWGTKAIRETGWDSSRGWNKCGHHDAVKRNCSGSSSYGNDWGHDVVKENPCDSPKDWNELDNNGSKTNSRKDCGWGAGKGVEENYWKNRGHDIVKANHRESPNGCDEWDSSGCDSTYRNGHGRGAWKGVTENRWDSSRGWNNRGYDGVKENHWDSSKDWKGWGNSSYESSRRKNRGWATWKGDCKKGETAGWHPSINKGPIFHCDDPQPHRGSRNDRQKKGPNVGYDEQTSVERRPSHWHC
ncbi:hypothetical protein Ancab_031083 [Ancistrocladus abbreviatus]